MRYFINFIISIAILSSTKYRNYIIFKKIMADFRTNLRSELDYQGLTVKELSGKTGIAKGTLDCYLGTRASMPPADIAVKIAKALGVTVEYLVTGEDSSIPNEVSRATRSILNLNQRDRKLLDTIVKSMGEL